MGMILMANKESATISQEVDNDGNINDSTVSTEKLDIGDSVSTRAGDGKVLQVAGDSIMVQLSPNSDYPGQVFEYSRTDLQKESVSKESLDKFGLAKNTTYDKHLSKLKTILTRTDLDSKTKTAVQSDIKIMNNVINSFNSQILVLDKLSDKTGSILKATGKLQSFFISKTTGAIVVLIEFSSHPMIIADTINKVRKLGWDNVEAGDTPTNNIVVCQLIITLAKLRNLNYRESVSKEAKKMPSVQAFVRSFVKDIKANGNTKDEVDTDYLIDTLDNLIYDARGDINAMSKDEMKQVVSKLNSLGYKNVKATSDLLRNYAESVSKEAGSSDDKERLRLALTLFDTKYSDLTKAEKAEVEKQL